MQMSIGGGKVGNHLDAEYAQLLDRVNARFRKNTAKQPVFTTDAVGLWEAYLSAFEDPAEKQFHNCNCCRQFIERFGGLVTIDEQGRTESAIWNEADASDNLFQSFAAMRRLVKRAKVTGVFLSSAPVWGTPETGVWRHLSVTPFSDMIYRGLAKDAGQAMAEKKEDFQTVMRALSEFAIDHLETALRLLRSDALYRSEKLLGQVEWLRGLKGVHSTQRRNVIWRAVATAPAGFCHPRAGMVGTLLEDIAAGKDYEEVSRAFAAKMHPLKYQRPQVAPKAGNIVEAEKLVEKLGIARSLERRFCRVDEVEALWKPAPKKEVPAGGVFGHLTPKGDAESVGMNIPPQVMTWEKFQRMILPSAERIQIRTPQIGNFCALVTAVHSDAPLIFQWPHPVSWYVWHGGSSPAQYGLLACQDYDVSAVTLKPSMWGAGCKHHGNGVIFIIDGARETKMHGNALFPEILKAELHGVHATIEAYSKKASIAGLNEPHAAGLSFEGGDTRGGHVRLTVWSGGQKAVYELDRWD